jgi:hypothetical protein
MHVDDNFFVMKHVLGRSRLSCSAAVKTFIDSFRLPRIISPEELDETRADWVSVLQEALILRQPGNEEAGRIRATYSWRATVPEHLLPDWPCLPVAVGIDAQAGALPLRLSSSLAVLKIDDDHFLITHPLRSPTQLSGSLWDFAQTFRAGGVMAPRHHQWAADFLVDAGILWPSAEAEVLAARAQCAPPADGAIDLRHPMVDRWRQSFMPYAVEDVAPSRANLSVALIGPCKIQQLAAALQYLATKRGWSLKLSGFLRPEPELASEPWTAVVMTASNLDGGFYEAMGSAQLDSLETITARALADTLGAIDQIRGLTDAPILVISLGRPALSAVSAFSTEIQRFNHAIASINLRLAEEIGTRPRVHLIDEDWIAVALSRGILWDDEINATGHHAPLSSWNWPIVKPGVSDSSDVQGDHTRLIPPRPHAQADPSAPAAAAILGGIERLVVAPVRLVILEPDDLLWRGRAGMDLEGPITPPTVYADVEDYLQSGLHEAFSSLRGRGIGIACITRASSRALEAVWKFRSTRQNLLRLSDMSAVRAGSPKSQALDDLIRELGIAHESILVVDLTHDYSKSFDGRVYRGDKWSLRRYLLTAPELDVLPRRPVA